MDIQMEITWEAQDDGSQICELGSYKVAAWRVGNADDPTHRVGIFKDGTSMGSLTLPTERIACQVGETALKLLAELDETSAETIDEVAETPAIEAGGGAETNGSEEGTPEASE